MAEPKYTTAPPRTKGFHEKFSELLIAYVAMAIIMWHEWIAGSIVAVALIIFTVLKVMHKPKGPVHKYTRRQLIGLYMGSVLLGCVIGIVLYPMSHGRI